MLPTLILAFAPSAFGQATPTGEFVGEFSEGMETVLAGAFSECYDAAGGQLCDVGAGSAMHVTGGWWFGCYLGPRSGSRLAGSAGTEGGYIFDLPVSSFGGWFGTNSGSGVTATFNFYTSSGALLDSEVVDLGGCGTWAWHGWTFSEPVAEVHMIHRDYAGFVMMDDLQIGPGGPALCAPGTASAAGVEPCGVCPAGTYTDAPGAFECSICENGTLNPDDGASSCEVPVIENDPVIPGFGTSVRITGLEPGARGYLMRGTSIGAGPCPGYLDGGCWDITSPVLARSALADASGVATFNFDVPIGLSPGTNFYVQAATLGPLGAVLSDPVVITVD